MTDVNKIRWRPTQKGKNMSKIEFIINTLGVIPCDKNEINMLSVLEKEEKCEGVQEYE